MFQQAPDDFMVWGKGRQSWFVGRVLAGLGFLGRGADLHDVEQDLTQLPR
jgi:hypothetical protein